MAHCPYCEAKTTLSKSSAHIYGGRDYGAVWECQPCHAYVGCRRGTTTAHGTPANATDRALRKRGHAVFDKLWKERGWTRSGAYKWFAGALGLPESETHFGMMNGSRLEEAVRVAHEKVHGPPPVIKHFDMDGWLQKNGLDSSGGQ